MLGKEYHNFSSDFIKCQQQTSEKVFWTEYNILKGTWPEACAYLDEQLTPNVRYWAGFRHTRFSTGAVSTQRGEGLNRHFKAHLSAQSPLSKLFQEVLLREEREQAKLYVSTVKDNMHTTQANTYAKSCYPDIHAEMQESLTGYGLSMLLKQVSAGANYAACEVDIETMEGLQDADPDVRNCDDLDVDTLDLPRNRTAAELIAGVLEEHHETLRVFRLDLLHTITNKPTNPQFLILYDKLKGRGAYQQHICTCGSAIRCGVPCRHFWGLLRSTTAATFHRGLVNDLWFRQAQALHVQEVGLHTYDDPANPIFPVLYERPVYPTNASTTEAGLLEKSKALAKDISEKRIWGTLLGEAKKANERAISTNTQDGLYSALQGFAAAGDQSIADKSVLVRNPDRVKGKGRPPKDKRARRDENGPAPRERVPLAAVGASTSNVDHGLPRDTPQEVEGHEPPAKRRQRKCKNCGQRGHDSRSCQMSSDTANLSRH